MTGVQRYAFEMISALDRLIAAGELPPELSGVRWVLLKPDGATTEIPLYAITSRVVGSRLPSHLWDQIALLVAARRGLLVSLANRGPILHQRQLVIVHDAIVFRHPEFYRPRYVRVHQLLGKALARCARVGTVSEFSRREIAEVLHLNPIEIPIIPNGTEHLIGAARDDSIIDELGLRHRRYFLTLGSLSGNKNVGLAVRAFQSLARSDARLVSVGGGGSVFKNVQGAEMPGVIQTGRLPDEKVAALYAHAAAFVFPSIYEGFGIPPLEAMTFGTPVLASTAGALLETCGDAATYFGANDSDSLAALMAGVLDAGPPTQVQKKAWRDHAASFSWRMSAEKLVATVSEMASPIKG